MSLLEKNINKNLQNPTDDKDAIMDIAAKNLVREVSARLRLLEEFSGSKYRNCITCVADTVIAIACVDNCLIACICYDVCTVATYHRNGDSVINNSIITRATINTDI